MTPATTATTAAPASTTIPRFDFSDAPGVSDAGGADVTSLPMDSFSFSTNPLASEETGPGSSGGTPRASGLRRMDEVESDPRGGGLDPRSRRPAIDEAPSAAARTPPASPFATAAMDRALTEGVDYPALPDWTGTRPYLTGEHLGSRDAAAGDAAPEPGKPLSAYSTACQELLILDDLLYAMMGVEGRYVRAERMDGGAVRFFVRRRRLGGIVGGARGGRVAAVFRGGGGVGVRRVPATVRGRFSGARTGSGDAGAAPRLAHDGGAARASAQRRTAEPPGRRGSTANPRWRRWSSSPPSPRARRLLRGAPLLNMLHAERWTAQATPPRESSSCDCSKPPRAPRARWNGGCTRVVDDPYDEFLVLERAHLRKESLAEDYNASYWTRRYALRADVPVFLGGDLAEKALTTGKYLNAIRESGASRQSSGERRERKRTRRRRGVRDAAKAEGWTGAHRDGDKRRRDARRAHRRRVQARLERFARAVLDEGDLHARLCTLKRYFLLDQGDFLVHFVDIAGHELRRRAPDISVNKLQSLLELSLKLSTAASDPRNEDLTCGLERQGIIHQLLSIHVAGEDGGLGPASGGGGHEAMTPKEALRLTGMDTFVLDYQRAVAGESGAEPTRADQVSATVPPRLPLQARRTGAVRGMARTNRRERRRRARRVWAPALERAYAVSQRMLHFLQNFTYYLMCEVVEPNWHVFERSLPEATTVDELIDLHERFLDACMKEGMLFWPKILRRLEKIKQSCLKFAEATASVGEASKTDPCGRTLRVRRRRRTDPARV